MGRKRRIFDITDYQEKYSEFCQNPRALWEIIVVSIIMSLVGILLASIMQQTEMFRAPIIVLWVTIPLGSVLYQGCIYPKNYILSWMDTACVLALMTLYAIVFIPIVPWWCWVIAVITIMSFIYYELRKYSKGENEPTVLEMIWLVNIWHTLTITTIICMYSSTVD